MKDAIKLYQVDAFADTVFSGNPAAVIPLDTWLDETLMQKIAEENNLSETAFIHRATPYWEIRWFTPNGEVDLCGHATLAAAFVIDKFIERIDTSILFQSNSGMLAITKQDGKYCLSFPALPSTLQGTPENVLIECINPKYLKAVYTGPDYLIELDSEQAVREFKPDFNAWQDLDARGVIVTAMGETYDFVSRCFYPKLNVNEDPVTGSAHCQLAPFWQKKLGKSHLLGVQASKREGVVECIVEENERVTLIGTAVLYMEATIYLD